MKIGASRVPLKWKLGLPLAGYIKRTLPSTGTHRDLYLRALVASSGGTTICLLSSEILAVDHALTERLRAPNHHALG